MASRSGRQTMAHRLVRSICDFYKCRGIDIDQYPAIKAYLSQFKAKLMPKPDDWDEMRYGKWLGRKAGSYQWYEIQDSTAYFEEFATTKIISTDIAKRPEFTIHEDFYFIDATLFSIPINDKFLLALLNSKVLQFYYENISSTIRGDYLRYKKIYVYKLPVATAIHEQKQTIEALVEELLSRPNSAQVDRLEIELTNLSTNSTASPSGRLL